MKNKGRPAIDVMFVISHGFAARMLIQTGLIAKLSRRGFIIGIVSPDILDPNLQQLSTKNGILLYDAKMKMTLQDDDFSFRRMYYLEDLGKNPVFYEKHIYNLLYSKSIHPWKRIRPLYYYFIYFLIRYFPSIRRRFNKRQDKNLLSSKATVLLQETMPKLVVSTYPINFLESKFLFAANKLGIRTVTQLLSWDNITSKGRFPVVTDHYILWGEVMAREMKNYYDLPESKLHICGVPHFDQHVEVRQSLLRNEVLKELKIPSNTPFLFFAMSAPRFAPNEIDVILWLKQKIEDDFFGKDIYLVVRPHPQNVQGSLADRNWIQKLKDLESSRVRIDFPTLNDQSNIRWSMKSTDMIRLSFLLNGCAICLNSGSTVSIDALFFDKPIVLTSFDGNKKLPYWRSAYKLTTYPHQKKFIETGAVKVATSFESLESSINGYLQDPDLTAINRDKALLKYCYSNDGRSTDRVVEKLAQLIDL